MVPAIADIGIAIVFFIISFDIWTGLVIGLSMVGYVGWAMLLSKWKAEYRREQNYADNLRQVTSLEGLALVCRQSI